MANNKPTTKQLREFGYLIGFGFPIILGWLLPALHGHAFRLWTLWIALPGLALGLFAPALLFWPYRAWMALGHALGWVNGHLVLGLVFVVVLQPIALLMRLLGHDPLRRKRSSALATYREDCHDSPSNLTRIF
ncbi:MAG: hypothetical protein RLZZ137_884 [Cyanobacteriota bacterium]|jgi:hypothetical protein